LLGFLLVGRRPSRSTTPGPIGPWNSSYGREHAQPHAVGVPGRTPTGARMCSPAREQVRGCTEIRDANVPGRTRTEAALLPRQLRSCSLASCAAGVHLGRGGEVTRLRAAEHISYRGPRLDWTEVSVRPGTPMPILARRSWTEVLVRSGTFLNQGYRRSGGVENQACQVGGWKQSASRNEAASYGFEVGGANISSMSPECSGAYR
jgi:hypothetical protein